MIIDEFNPHCKWKVNFGSIIIQDFDHPYGTYTNEYNK